MTTAIQIKNLNVAYGKQTVLKGVSVDIPQGKLTAILGENGCGKSTLLNSICRLNSINTGYISLFGKPLSSFGYREMAQTISFVSQHSDIVPITAYDYMMMGRTPHRSLFSIHDSQGDKDIVESVISRLSLDDIRNKRMDQLSGGERQLASIARAIIQDTPIILLDEPTANLDIKNQEEIMRILQHEALERGKTIVIVMHDLNLAARYAEYIIMIQNGIATHHGAAQDTLNSRNLSELYHIELREITDQGCTIYTP